MSQKVTAEHIKKAIENKFCRPEWATFFEVGNGTGGNLRRWADAISMNMFPSRGLAIVGFEIKVARNDLQKELENPQKAEEIGKYCDQWFLVVPKGLIKEMDIIPMSWGVMEYSDGSLRQTKKPQQLNPQPVTKQFVAALLRRADESKNKEFANAVQEKVNKQIAGIREFHEQELTRARNEVSERTKRLMEQVRQFEQASGIMIDQYTDGKKLGEAVVLINKIGITGTYGAIEVIRRNMMRFLDDTEKVLKTVEIGEKVS